VLRIGAVIAASVARPDVTRRGARASSPYIDVTAVASKPARPDADAVAPSAEGCGVAALLLTLLLKVGAWVNAASRLTSASPTRPPGHRARALTLLSGLKNPENGTSALMPTSLNEGDARLANADVTLATWVSNSES
jgi:hypothetical protein